MILPVFSPHRLASSSTGRASAVRPRQPVRLCWFFKGRRVVDPYKCLPRALPFFAVKVRFLTLPLNIIPARLTFFCRRECRPRHSKEKQQNFTTERRGRRSLRAPAVGVAVLCCQGAHLYLFIISTNTYLLDKITY